MFTTMGLKEQQTTDNLIVKDCCFITEKIDKFDFSGIRRGCLSHLNESKKNKHLPDNWYCEINYNSLQWPLVFFIFARANFFDSHRTS